MADYYRESVICTNGHRQTSMKEPWEPMEDKYCSKCGAEYIFKCTHCDVPIKGDYHMDGVITLGYDAPIPLYCTACGEGYPWTESLLKNAQRILELDKELSSDDKKQALEDIPNLIKDTPEAKVSAYSFKDIMSRAGAATADMLKDILSNVISDVITKTIYG